MEVKKFQSFYQLNFVYGTNHQYNIHKHILQESKSFASTRYIICDLKTQTKAGTAAYCCCRCMSLHCVWVVIVDIKRRLHDYKNTTLHGIPILYLF